MWFVDRSRLGSCPSLTVVGDVRIDESVLAVFAELKDRRDRRLSKSAALGGVAAAVHALSAGTREDIESVARPWDVQALVEASVRSSPHAFDDVVIVEVRADADPLTLLARLGDGSHLMLRGAGDREISAWRAVRVVDSGTPVPAINPERSLILPFPDDAADELRWICQTLEEVSDALGDPIHAAPGHPPSDASEDLGQGETRYVQRVAWLGQPHGSLEATTARHEIYDGATPTWTHLHGLVMGLADDSACVLNATVRANEDPVVTVLLCAPRARLDRAVEELT